MSAVRSRQYAVGSKNRFQVLRYLLLTACCLLPTVPGCQPALNRQPKISKPDQASSFFADGRASRPQVQGTVARGQVDDNPRRATGKNGDKFVTEFPVQVTEPMVLRGQERFNIYCAACHDRLGTGNGKVVQRGYIKPPSFHIDDSRGLALLGQNVKLTDVPIGYIFQVITDGFGAMPSHGDMIPVEDRWAIVAYVRALQLRDDTGDKGGR